MNTMSEQSLQKYEPDTTAVVPVQVQPPAMFGNSPELVIANAVNAANALKAVLRSQGLISNIQGKEYPRCEAWTLLGTMVGVFPVLCWSKPIEGGWEARVEARMRDGTVIGAAESQCARSEKTWANRDDYAIRSMAQTRATAKALRMPLGFVMTLAGYEPTPAEEMASGEPQQPAGRVQTTRTSPTPVLPTKAPAIGATAQGEAKGSASPQGGESDAARRKAKFLQIIAEKQWGLYAWLYAVSQGWILDTERLEDANPDKFPKTEGEMAKIDTAIKKMLADAAEHGGISQAEQEAYDQAHFEPSDNDGGADDPEEDDSWKDLEVPKWSKHFKEDGAVTFGDLDSNQLWWWCCKWQPTGYKGKPPKAEDMELRRQLDNVRSLMNFTE